MVTGMDWTAISLERLTESQLRDALAAGELDPVGLVPAPPLEKMRPPDSKLTALMLIAATNPNPDLIDVLVEAGAVVDATSPESSMTALSLAAAANPNGEVVTRLIEHGADCERRDNLGWTPLVYAALMGNRKAVLALIPHVPNLDALDPRGWTALAYALARRNIDIAEVLMAAGAGKNAPADGTPDLARAYRSGCKTDGIQPSPEVLAWLAR